MRPRLAVATALLLVPSVAVIGSLIAQEAPSRTVPEEGAARLVAAVKAANADERREAERELRALGDSAVEVLDAVLKKETDSAVRGSVAALLAAIGTARAKEALARFVVSGSGDVDWLVVSALARTTGAVTLPGSAKAKLIDAAAAAASGRVGDALLVLARDDGKEVADVAGAWHRRMLAAVEMTPEPERGSYLTTKGNLINAGIRALRLARPELRAVVLTTLKTDDRWSEPGLREWASVFRGFAGDRDAREHVLRLAKAERSEDELRYFSVLVLGVIGDAEDVEFLTSVAASSEKNPPSPPGTRRESIVGLAARPALTELTARLAERK